MQAASLFCCNDDFSMMGVNAMKTRSRFAAAAAVVLAVAACAPQTEFSAADARLATHAGERSVAA
jgi:hypothetical protein